MLKFFGLTLVVCVIAIACCWYIAPEITRSTALRMVELVGSQANIDKSDKSSFMVKLVSRAENLLRPVMPVDESVQVSDYQLEPNVSMEITNAFFGDENVDSKEGLPAAGRSPFVPKRADTWYEPIDTGAEIQSNPFLN